MTALRSPSPSTSPSTSEGRQIVHCMRGRKHGPITRLVSPGDLGELMKPFVFLDFIDHQGEPVSGALHPHSGIATLSYLSEGEVNYIDHDGSKGVLAAKGVEWMQAGGGMWHGGGMEKAGRTRGFQLWVALPPELELQPASSVYLAPESVPVDGPARVLLGAHGSARNPIAAPSPINYLAIRLKAGERWTYQPPADHTVLWVAVALGSLSAPRDLSTGELAIFEPSSQAVAFEALTDAEFVLGSATPHKHDLVLGYYSVHTSAAALRDGEAHIEAIQADLIREGRL